MAREIHTEDQIIEAIQTVWLSGANPSVATVQKKLGGGGTSRVASILKEWKKSRADNKLPVMVLDIPESLSAKTSELFAAIWKEASDQALLTCGADAKRLEAEAKTLEGKLEDFNDEVKRLNSELKKIGAEKHQLTLDVRRLEGELQHAKDSAQKNTESMSARAGSLSATIASLETQLESANKINAMKSAEIERIQKTYGDDKLKASEEHKAAIEQLKSELREDAKANLAEQAKAHQVALESSERMAALRVDEARSETKAIAKELASARRDHALYREQMDKARLDSQMTQQKAISQLRDDIEKVVRQQSELAKQAAKRKSKKEPKKAKQ